jgi:hypothetical protein
MPEENECWIYLLSNKYKNKRELQEARITNTNTNPSAVLIGNMAEQSHEPPFMAINSGKL